VTVPGFLLPLHTWALNQTGDDAKSPLALRFDPPATIPAHFNLRAFDTGDLGTNGPMSRLCCALGSSGALDVASLSSEPHDSRPANTTGFFPGGGAAGYVYTRRGGFIDLGHVRDYIDFTRFFASRFREAPLAGLSATGPQLFSEAGDVHLIVAPRALRPDPVLSALIGAKLAYERATWHEIASYFPGPTDVDQKFSSFAPEDNFSNAVGVLAGYRAALTPDIEFNAAADKELSRILGELQSVSKADTTRAIDFVDDFWFDGLVVAIRPNSKRRHFGARPPVTPWLVTDITVPGKTAEGDALRMDLGRPRPATIDFPASYNGQVLDDLARLEITSIPAVINDLRPVAERATPLTSAKLWALVVKVRMEEVFVNNDGDSPGEPAP
jgi:hypothetical protein